MALRAAEQPGPDKGRLGAKMLRPQHMPALGEALAKHEVKEVFLQSNQLGTAGGAALADALRKHRTMEYLNLDSNALGDEGVEALAAAFQEGAGRELRELELVNNGITAKGARAVAACLGELPSLQELLLRGNLELAFNDAAKQTLREAVAGREGFQLRF